MSEKKYQVLVADQIAAEGVALLRESFEVIVNGDITPEELVAQIDQNDALIVRSRTKVVADVVEAGSRLKVVGRAGVGVDNIDLEACRQNNVMVVNSPNAATISVAEHTLGLIFSLLRRIPEADSSMKEGQWLKKNLKGDDLFGKTLGLVGLGRIGSSVAELAKALGMRVMAYDPFLNDDEIEERQAEPTTLDALLTQVDILSIHTPYTENTHHLFDQTKFAKMKTGIYIICAARGGVIDEDALLDALNSGHVAGAALDVFETEPPGATSLVLHPKVIATPHIAAQTTGGQTRAGVDVAEEITAALKKQPLRWRVI